MSQSYENTSSIVHRPSSIVQLPEATIAHRTRKVDRALPEWNLGIWLITILVLVGGSALIIATAGRAERVRMLAMERVTVGQPGTSVIDALHAQPLRCSADDLGHLRASFPEGWSPAAMDVAIERLAAVTEERWLFSTDGSPLDLCAPEEGQTEIGLSPGGLVVWMVALRGRSELRGPDWLTPAGVQGQDGGGR